MSDPAKKRPLRRYIIERDVPGVGASTAEQTAGAAAASCVALSELGTDIQWVQSFIAADKTFCVYLAVDEDVIRRHGEISGFPVSKITQITGFNDPTLAN
jgi:hypothetical protein